MAYDFVGKRKVWYSFSILLLGLAFFALAYNGFVHGKLMNFGIDFTGGTLLNIRFTEPVKESDVRDVLAKFSLGEITIQRSGENDLYIRGKEIDRDTRVSIIDDLRAKYGEVELLEADSLGPVIGRELRSQSIWALLIASLGIIAYVSFRFEFKYAAVALIALYHDALITTGLIALLWRNVETPFIAAILTIMGFSINDTIVIFDRIRENIKIHTKKKKFSEIVNISVHETLARSINTNLTALVSVLAILFFGGETLRDFSLVLLIGFVVGSYSTIFIASPLVALWESDKK